MIDLSAAVSPLYFGAMAVERRVLEQRALEQGPSAADYEREDTRTSLAMGTLSLTTPLTVALVTWAAPFRVGRRSGTVGRVIAGVAVTAAVVTTTADLMARHAPRFGVNRERVRRAARRAAEVGGVVTVAAGGLVIAGSTAALGSASRLWRRGQRHDLGRGPLPWALALVWWDLAYYWNHRLEHEVRAFWAMHVVHHSSERYNLATALRQPVAGALVVGIPQDLPVRIGVRPSLMAISRSLNLIYQFWIHTDTVRTLGPAEEVLNTPSHHRVHHGSNRRYLDRNHGGILIVWDRLFGTFTREDPDEPVRYGLTTNIGTFDPWKVITHEYRDMFREVARAESWRDRLGAVFGPPGWTRRRREQGLLSSQQR